MIKTIYKTIVCATLVAGLSSCVNDWLDTDPVDGTDSEKAITSSSELNTARIGMYQIFKGTSTFSSYYAARMFYYGEVRGEDMQSDKSGSRSQSCYNMTYSTADDAPGIWQVPYIVIGRANQIIQAAENGNLLDAEKAKDIIAQYSAEAKAVRAIAHFDLVRVYGKTYTADNGASLGVPIVASVLPATEQLSRNTVAEVYEQVTDDLNEVINSNALPKVNTTGYMNHWAAKALLTRVYLTKGDNANALKTAEDIIENSPYQLWSTAEYSQAWDESNPVHNNEIIFEFSITKGDDWTDREGIASLYSEQGYGDIVATQKFLNILQADTADVRLSLFAPAEQADHIKTYGTNPVYMQKFYIGSNDDYRKNNVPLLRLSEVYLSAAEAAMKQGDTNKAAKYLDAIVNRANNANHITASDVTLEKILLERRKELVGEGQRFFDAMRNNETVIRYTSDADRGWHQPLKEEAKSFTRDFYKTILPIPADEMNANPAMKGQQNPGY